MSDIVKATEAEVVAFFKEVETVGVAAVKKTEAEARAILNFVEEHTHLLRASKHAVAMAAQSGDPKVIDAAKEQHASTMAVVASSPFTKLHVDIASQAVLNATGYVAPTES